MNADALLEWFGDNVDFFETITEDELNLVVPNCPGWTIVDLLNHLSFGLGVCYPIAAVAPPGTTADVVFVDADRSTMDSEATEARELFGTNMRSCLRELGSLNPASPCWTYEGPGQVMFWLRRAAVETALHRFDAEVALGRPVTELSQDRADEAIDETVDFALPLACAKVGAPPSKLQLNSTDTALVRSVGSGAESTTLAGSAQSLLLALWGRKPIDELEVDGDNDQAELWLTLVGRAFSGR